MAHYQPANRNLFSNAYLDTQCLKDSLALEQESRKAFDKIFIRRREATPERYGDGLEAELRKEYLDGVLDSLGWLHSTAGHIPEDGSPDYTLFAAEEDRASALPLKGKVEFFDKALALCEAKPWGTNLFRKAKGEESPRGQIYRYVENTHRPWGMVTNGKEWMLVWRDYSRAQQRDYTVDLDALLSGNEWTPDFNYFFAFFGKEGFTRGFLQQALKQSRISGTVVGKSLKANVYEALLVLGRAIHSANPTKYNTGKELDELKSDCLTLLYRLLFVNYAESRKLLPMGDSETYRTSYSLLRIKESIQKVVPRMDTNDYLAIPSDGKGYLKGIRLLFAAIDKGLPIAEIPPYNGGLFRSKEHPTLEALDIDDRTVARVVDLLSRTREDPERFVDYSYLGVRELGSIYEGLLEYEFKVAATNLVAVPDKNRKGEVWVALENAPGDSEAVCLARVAKGELYVSTAKGQRKRYGAVYTPDEVVKYIVPETLGPVVQRKVEEARRLGQDPILAILNTKVLDPAMGSGHFLVAATEYLAGKLLEVIEHQGIGPADLGGDEEIEAWAKRQVVSHCIYGVDLNPMAVELAKVSLWLTTFSRGHPLSFLDHRLKCGNSLIGSRIEEMTVLPSVERQVFHASSGRPSRVKTLDFFTGLVGGFRRPIEQVERIQENTVGDVERKKSLYLGLIQDPSHRRFVTLANAHTGLRYTPPSDRVVAAAAWDRLVQALAEPDTQSWDSVAGSDLVAQGSLLAKEKSPFHWDVEYPEVFARPHPGFDAVIGNPPYVRIYRGQLSEEDTDYFKRRFQSAYMKFDLYTLFLELGIGLLRQGGRLGFIVPDKFATAPYGEPIRDMMLRNLLLSLLDLRKEPVFPGVAVSPVVVILERGSQRDARTRVLRPINGWEQLDPPNLETVGEPLQESFKSYPHSQIRVGTATTNQALVEVLTRNSFPLSRAFYVNWGLRTGTKERTDRMITVNPQGTNPKPLLRGEDLRERYLLERPPRFIDYDTGQLYNPLFPEFFEKPKLVFRKISGPEGLRAVVDESGAYCFCTLICAVNMADLRGVHRTKVKRPGPEAKRFRDPWLVLAVANSRLIAWWYQRTYSDGLGVNPRHVEAIPLPQVLLGVDPLSHTVDISRFTSEGIGSEPPEVLEGIVSACGAKMQALGDSLAKETSGFCDWLRREMGPAVDWAVSRRIADGIEDLDESALVALLEKLHGVSPLLIDPHSRDVQERVAKEFANTKSKVTGFKREMRELDRLAEDGIHLLFGLDPEQSTEILGETTTRSRTP